MEKIQRQIYYFRGNKENGSVLLNHLVKLTNANHIPGLEATDRDMLYYNDPYLNQVTELEDFHEPLLKAASAKEIEFVGNMRWRAAIGKEYWCIDPAANIVEFTDGRTEYANTLWEKGNYFQSNDDAEKD